MAKKLLYPELEEGIRVQYKDKNEATRQGRIVARRSNTISVVGALKTKARVSIENITGYWQPKVKASPKNFVKLLQRQKPNLPSGVEVINPHKKAQKAKRLIKHEQKTIVE